jgi:hypothetical protein
LIITVPTAQMCIESDAPVAVRVMQKTPYEFLMEIGPALLAAYVPESRGPPLPAYNSGN